jgi:hypothetical protein
MIRHIFLRLVRNAVSVKRVIVLHPILFFNMKVRKNERFFISRFSFLISYRPFPQ